MPQRVVTTVLLYIFPDISLGQPTTTGWFLLDSSTQLLYMCIIRIKRRSHSHQHDNGNLIDHIITTIHQFGSVLTNKQGALWF
jgi:hypothetical protein